MGQKTTRDWETFSIPMSARIKVKSKARRESRATIRPKKKLDEEIGGEKALMIT